MKEELLEAIFNYIKEHEGIAKVKLPSNYLNKNFDPKDICRSVNYLIYNSFIVSYSFHEYLALHENVKLILKNNPNMTFSDIQKLFVDENKTAELLVGL